MVTAVKPIETTQEALLRMAAKARKNGCTLLVESSTEETFITSATMSGIIYKVTPTSCGCTGHAVWGRCQHRALLLWLTGAIVDPDPEPTPLSMTAAIKTPTDSDELRRLAIARSEVVRLSRDPKSTADFRNLQNAQARLNELTTPYLAAVA